MISIAVFLHHGVDCKLVTIVCFTSPDQDHDKLWKLMTGISFFHYVSIMEALCLFYLMRSSTMKLRFYIMVSLQNLIG
jgi:hypothetical protein